MGDSEKDMPDRNISIDDVTVEDIVAKTTKSAGKKKTGKAGKFSEFVAEFKKIVWPSRTSTFRQTTAVIISSVLIGAIIVVVDMVIRLGLELVM